MSAGVDRTEVVARHSPHYRAHERGAPLTVGNGEFCFTADVTGLQTFPAEHPVASEGSDPPGTLLSTMTQWAWHSTPGPAYDLNDAKRPYRTPHGTVPYVDLTTGSGIHTQHGATRGEEWLRNNPHRLDLARLGLHVDGERLDVEALTGIDQRLDLQTGILTSAFSVRGRRFTVRTAAHPSRDAVAVLLDVDDDGPVGVRIAFPYGSEAWGNAADWQHPELHRSVLSSTAGGWRIDRRLDDSSYVVAITAPAAEMLREGEHEFVLQRRGSLALTVEFVSEGDPDALEPEDVHRASASHWDDFWNSGAAVDLSGSDDDRAFELERRIVLSQYLTAVQCAGSTPPGETGLTANSWRGKFHLEMHWWHAAHFALWHRPELLERSLPWYERVLPRARATAEEQGLHGARWPKQVGPDGREAPSSIGPFLVWQQPHPIYLAELVYRARPDRATLERWAPIVFATAEFMASYAQHESTGYALGPPLIPAQESYAEQRAAGRNPTFELAYWGWALNVAAEWRARLALPEATRWRQVADGMASPPQEGGRYLALATPPGLVREDHPSMLLALGMVPSTRHIDPRIMQNTLDDVLRDWDWDSTWGWDYPTIAMTATRLGRPSVAVDALLADRGKNTFLRNGHNWQTERLPIYLPGNGGLLSAVALMTGGWDGSAATPGFDARWHVRHEGFVPAPA